MHIIHKFLIDYLKFYIFVFKRCLAVVWWVVRMIEIRWMNSDVLRLDRVDGLLARKKKKKVIVEKS